MTPLLLAGCFASILEAPYVLATGTGAPAHHLAAGLDEHLLVASDQGVRAVDGSGAVTPRSDTPVAIALQHRGWQLTIDARQARFDNGAVAELTGAVAATAWCEHSALVARPGALVLLAPDGSSTQWATAPSDVVDVGLAPGPACETALVLTPTSLQQVSPTGRQVLADGLVAARAIAQDAHGRVWMVHDDPPVLAVIRDGQPQTIARYLGDVVDLHFGTGGLLHPDNAYLLNRDGQLDYVRVPTP